MKAQYSKRSYLICFTQKDENTGEFSIVNYSIDFEKLISDNGDDDNYYALGRLDDVLDLKIGESMYIEPDYGHYLGKGIILRTN